MQGKPARASMLVNVPLDSSRPTIRRRLTLPCRNKGLPSAPQDIVAPHSKRPSMSGISSPSVRRFACSESSTRLMASCFLAWTRQDKETSWVDWTILNSRRSTVCPRHEVECTSTPRMLCAERVRAGSHAQNWNRHRANDCVAVDPQVAAIRVAPGNQQVRLRLLHSLAQHLGRVTEDPLPR